MRELTLVVVFLCIISFAYQEPIEHLEQLLVYPVEPATKKTKRETSKPKLQREFNEFVEDKLIQHTQALEHLVKLAQSNEEITKQLVETLSHKMESPSLPEKIEVYNNVRRSGLPEPDHPIVKVAKNIPQYGVLFKDLIWAELRTDEEPTAVVENDSNLVVPLAGNPYLFPAKGKRTNQVPGVQLPFCAKER